MATVSGTWTIQAGHSGGGRLTANVGGQKYEHTFTGGDSTKDPILRAILDEFRQNGTTSGSVTVTAS